MHINKEQTDDLNVIISVQIEKNDYESKVNEVLRDYRRKANMPGFRPGKVPEGLIRKMYGKSVLIDEINKLVSESLQKYIEEQQFQMLGEMLPKSSSEDVEWEIGNDFSFDFEIGLAPKIEVNLSKEDQLTKYQIIVEKEMIDRHIENLADRNGNFVDTDAVVDFNEKLEGDIVQLGDDGEPLPDGLSADDTMLFMEDLKIDEEKKKTFENAKAGDEIVFNLWETFPNERMVASILKKQDKEEVGDISASQFQFTVKSVKKFAAAELNQELFDKLFGKDAVTNLEEFENRVRDDIAASFEDGAATKFKKDMQEYLLDKINPQLPEEFLRKWLKTANKDVDDEVFAKEFPMFLSNMKWEVIANAIIKQNEIKISDQDIIDFAKTITRKQLLMYGITNISDDDLAGFTNNYLKEEKNVRATASQVLDGKLADFVKNAVDLTLQEISLDDFNNMMKPSNKEEVEVVETETAEVTIESVEEVIENTEEEVVEVTGEDKETTENVEVKVEKKRKKKKVD